MAFQFVCQRQQKAAACTADVEHQRQPAVCIDRAPVQGLSGHLVLCTQGIDVLPYATRLDLQQEASSKGFEVECEEVKSGNIALRNRALLQLTGVGVARGSE